jgi:hypothetical protein
VIERCAEPTTGGVACVAGSGIPRGNVIGNTAAHRLRAVPVGLMAAIASSVRGGQGIVAVQMAGRARGLGGIGVSPGERPARCGVIKFPVGPIQGVVAGGALGGGKARGDVIWHVPAKGLCAGPGGLVAAETIGVRGGEVGVVAGVAVGASRNLTCRGELMRAGERPAGGAVVESGVVPGDCVVARGTI